jgi:hypothetical protein
MKKSFQYMTSQRGSVALDNNEMVEYGMVVVLIYHTVVVVQSIFTLTPAYILPPWCASTREVRYQH